MDELEITRLTCSPSVTESQAFCVARKVWRVSRFAMLILANLCIATAALVIWGAHAQDSKEAWAELILTNLPARGSHAYKNLLALAGKEAWGQIQPYTQSEV